jgi:choline dehydrogenase-like flavoprotein
MNFVVGSGPSGVACAAALLAQGREVCLLDAGLRLETEREDQLRKLGALPPENWTAQDRAWVKQGVQATAAGIPDKLLFGSNFPYREAQEQLNVEYGDTALRASLAFGGLSNVWGAAMLPYAEQDLAGWPISSSELAPHYTAALNLTGLSATQDGLKEKFPLHTTGLDELPPCRQARAVLDRMEHHRERLRQAGIFFGRARVAIRGSRQSGGCVSCGLCMFGCAYGSIYNSQQTVTALQQQKGFTYRPNVVVQTLRESGNEVRVVARDRLTRDIMELSATRVFLAAGVIPSTAILLRSLAAPERTVFIKDSHYFLLPVLLTRRVPDVQRERLHTLSQIFLEIMDPKISAHTVHFQMYSYNELFGQVVRSALGPLARPLNFFAREMECRLMLLQGFLHSAESGRLAATLRDNRLELRAEANAHSRKVVGRLVRKLLRHSLEFGVIPLPLLLQTGKVGRSFHAGGSFPMRAQPREFETDTLGRPAGWQRVHVVDATVLPDIPATTITLPVMANAHRIGTFVAASS